VRASLRRRSGAGGKGQTTIPKELRDSLGLQLGDRMSFALMPDKTVVLRVKSKSVMDLAGLLPEPVVLFSTNLTSLSGHAVHQTGLRVSNSLHPRQRLAQCLLERDTTSRFVGREVRLGAQHRLCLVAKLREDAVVVRILESSHLVQGRIESTLKARRTLPIAARSCEKRRYIERYHPPESRAHLTQEADSLDK